MQFSSILLFAGLSAAAAVPSFTKISSSGNGTTSTNGTAPADVHFENVDISSFYVREQLAGNTLNVQSIESVEFTIDGNTTCSAQNPGTSGNVFTCGTSAYRFGLINGTTTQYGLRVYKQTSPFAGMSGIGDITTTSRSGGGSIQLAQQVGNNTIVITGMNGARR